MYGTIRFFAGFAAFAGFPASSATATLAFAPALHKLTTVDASRAVRTQNGLSANKSTDHPRHGLPQVYPDKFAVRPSAVSPATSSGTQLSAFLGDGGATLTTASDVFTSENIKVAFSVATFLPQIFWVFLILLPNWGFTKKLMGGYEIVTLCCLVHFFIVSASIAQPDGTAPMLEFADVFDPAGDPQKAMVGMMQYPNFVSEEWSHVLTWDLFVGRWIWLDGLRRGIFTGHSVLLCNLIGPPGLLLHWATCLLTGKGVAPNEAVDLDDEK